MGGKNQLLYTWRFTVNIHQRKRWVKKECGDSLLLLKMYPLPNSLDELIDSFSSSKFYNSNIRIHLRMCFYPLGEYTGEDIVVSLLFKTAPFTRKTPPGQSTKGRQFITACITDTAVSRS